METTAPVPMMGDVPDIRARIEARLRKLDWTTYQLWKAVEPHGVPKQTVYDFLSGKSAINSTYLGHIMDALDLDVREKR